MEIYLSISSIDFRIKKQSYLALTISPLLSPHFRNLLIDKKSYKISHSPH